MTNSIEIYLKQKSEEILEYLKKVVNIPSGTFIKSGIDTVGEIFAERLRQLGFIVDKIPQNQYGDHIIAVKKGNNRKHLLCLGHLDTVYQDADYKRKPFTLDGSRAYGPGVLDTKSGILIMLYGIEALKVNSNEIFENIDLHVLLNSDEEIHSPTSREVIISEAKKCDTVCVFEPARPDGEYITQRKGIGVYSVDVIGRAAHAGAQPELGVSAINELCHYVLQINKLSDLSSGTSLNVGIIRGGTRSNVVAESAHAEVDIRSLDPKLILDIKKKLEEIAQEPCNKGAKIIVTELIDTPPLIKSEKTVELFDIIRKIGEETGIRLNDTTVGGGSDGNFTSQYTPTIDGMGGQGAGHHNVEEEYLLVNSLVERSIIFSKFVCEWFKTFPAGNL
jgi:glutamate carboxypeptidase